MVFERTPHISLKILFTIINGRMYDVDGNGVIDQDEMTKIIQVEFQKKFQVIHFPCCRPSMTC